MRKGIEHSHLVREAAQDFEEIKKTAKETLLCAPFNFFEAMTPTRPTKRLIKQRQAFTPVLQRLIMSGLDDQHTKFLASLSLLSCLDGEGLAVIKGLFHYIVLASLYPLSFPRLLARIRARNSRGGFPTVGALLRVQLLYSCAVTFICYAARTGLILVHPSEECRGCAVISLAPSL